MDRHRRLLGDLLAGIDDAARTGLLALDRAEGGPDTAGAAAVAALVAERIEHVLSIVSPARTVVPPVEKFAPDARIAFGHAQELANRLAVESNGSEVLADALEGVSTAPGVAGRWRWRAIGVASGRIAGPFSYSREHRIISGTLAIIGDHVERALSTIDAAATLASAGAVAEDLGHAARALARSAAHEAVQRAFHPHVDAAMSHLEKLDRAAQVRGLRQVPELAAVAASARAVRIAVGLEEMIAASFAL